MFGTFEVGVTSQFISKKGGYSGCAVGVASIWVGAGASLGGMHSFEYLCVCVWVGVLGGVHTCMCRNVSEYVMCKGVCVPESSWEVYACEQVCA